MSAAQTEGLPDEELERLADVARLVLKVQARLQLSRSQSRLDGLDAINWEGVKCKLRERFRLRRASPAEDAGQIRELTVAYLLNWLEELLVE